MIGVSGMHIQTMNFSAGESHVKIDFKNGNDANCLIHDYGFGRFMYFPRPASVSLNDHIMCILLVRDILQDADIGLFLPYLPYSRQDRRTHPSAPFSLRAFAKILETARFSHVYTLDAHSHMAEGLIENLVNITIHDMFAHYSPINKLARTATLVVPDDGARKRLELVEDYFDNVVYVHKRRDPRTGYLTIEEIYGDYQEKECLIVDDICDGGRTFTEIAKKMAGGPFSTSLFTTHGIYSKGTMPLFDMNISNLFTTDSFVQEQDSRKKVFKSLDILRDVLHGKLSQESIPGN
jgi:ribose-phosphate pyrophosphokinase